MKLSAGMATVAAAGLCLLLSCGSDSQTSTPPEPGSDASSDAAHSDALLTDVAGGDAHPGDSSKPDVASDVASDGSKTDAKHDAPAADVGHDTAVADAAQDAVPDVDFSYDGGPTTAWSKLPAKCAAAAEKGVVWLVSQQKSDGSWGSAGDHMLAATGLAVVKLEAYAIENGKSPFRDTYQYHTEVVNGLNYLLPLLTTVPVAGAFDANGDGFGVAQANVTSYTNYVNSIILMAVTAGGGFDQIVNAPASPIHGWTYQHLAQDMVDYFAQCQSTSLGGWRYTCPREDNDNSVSQYVSLALEYAEHPDYAFQCTLLPSVNTGLWTWVTYIQDMSTGGAGYDSPGNWQNPYKTGAILQELALLKQGVNSPQVVAALGYLDANWAAPMANNPADYMAMWAIMKGLVSQGVTMVGAHDWYQEYCDLLVSQQNPDGSWAITGYDTADSAGVLSTTWALLILEKVAPAALY